MSRRPFVRPRPAGWWLSDRRRAVYLLRENTALLVGLYSMILTMGLIRLSQGRAAWDGFVAALTSPLGVWVQLLALALAVFHAVTWFKVAPKAMPALIIKGTRVPDSLITRGHYVAWAVLSLAVLIVLGG
jgi:fumarate reductase subunit C